MMINNYLKLLCVVLYKWINLILIKIYKLIRAILSQNLIWASFKILLMKRLCMGTCVCPPKAHISCLLRTNPFLYILTRLNLGIKDLFLFPCWLRGKIVGSSHTYKKSMQLFSITAYDCCGSSMFIHNIL